MKKVFLIVAVIAFVGVSIVSCKSEKKEHHEHAEVAYVCPMVCEGDKTYADKSAKCPVCKMALVEKKPEGFHEHDSDSKEHK